MLELKKLKINKRNINHFKDKYGWDGDGTRLNPIEVKSTHNVSCMLNFKTGDLYIKISDVTHHSLKLKNTQNIIIENSAICNLEMYDCSHILIKNNSIANLVMHYCKGNTFTGNNLQDRDIYGLNNYDPKESLGLLIGILLPVSIFFWGYMIYLFTIVFENSFTLSLGSWNFIGLMSFFTVVFTYGLIDSVIANKKLNKLDFNTVTNNNELSPQNYLKLYCENCNFNGLCNPFYTINYENSVSL